MSNSTIEWHPEFCFGRPRLKSSRVTTDVLADRVRAGESVDDVALDMHLSIDDVREAVMFEEGARWQRRKSKEKIGGTVV